MGIKAFNHGDDFVNKFVRAVTADSTGLDAVNPEPPPPAPLGPAQGITATGGVISDYTTTPGDVYRAHVFTSAGVFEVTNTADSLYGTTVEYLVVAGGGSGGAHYGGGGGAGGLRTNVPGVQDSGGNPLTGSAFPISVSTYPVTIGAGGAAGSGSKPGNSGGRGNEGGDTTWNSLTSPGGGAGGEGLEQDRDRVRASLGDWHRKGCNTRTGTRRPYRREKDS